MKGKGDPSRRSPSESWFRKLVRKAVNSVGSKLNQWQTAAFPMAARRRANLLLICAYTLCVAIEGWTSNAINVVLLDIAGTIGASSDETSWIVTVYSVGAGISIVTSHGICKITGERLYILLACLLFGFASAGCALSTSLLALLTFRVLQGLAGGAFMSRTLVLLMTHFAPDERSSPLRYYLLILFIIGRAVSPVAAGYCSDLFSWRAVFWLNVIASLISAWFFCFVPNQEKLIPPPSKRRLHFDFLGAALLALGVVGIQVVISRGEVDDWLGSPLIRASFVLGVGAHIGFVLWQLSPSNRYPLVHLRHLFRRELLSVVMLGVFLGMLFSAVTYIFPFYLRRYSFHTHSAFQTGAMLALIGLPMVGLATVAPRFVAFVQKLGGRVVLSLGLTLEIVSSGLMIVFLSYDTPDVYLLLPLVLIGVFIYVTAVGLAVAGFARIPVRRISNARTLYFGARQLGNSLGISLGIILLDRRQLFHSQRLLEAYFLRNRSILGHLPQLSLHSTAKAFSSTVAQQSMVLAYQDMFAAIIAVCLLAMGFVFFLPSPGNKEEQERQKEDSNSTWSAETLAVN